MSALSLASLPREEILRRMREWGEPAFRADQVQGWVFRRLARDYDAMTNVPRSLRDRMREAMPVRSTAIASDHVSGDGTTKLLLRLHDGETVECVLIPEGERRTACLSTQVGCGVGCVFCASGAAGVVRNLEAGEIVEQALWLTERAGARLTNVVVMGMGEPLHNASALVAALRILQEPGGMDLGSRRITVSTSGPRAGFDELFRSGLKVQLAISLHAPTDALRRRLVPRGGTGSVEDLLRMADEWFRATGRDVTFEYVLLDGVNDRDADAEELARRMGAHRNVNLIPMNEVPFAPGLRAPPPERCERFAGILERRGVVVNLRRRRGDDVAAACGQLRLQRAAPPSGGL
jgi:23S rRNA (adenine2503-C2)-methyltransferase